MVVRSRNSDDYSIESEYRKAAGWSKFSLQLEWPASRMSRMLAIWLLGIIAALPWYYGSVTWFAQFCLVIVVLPLPALVLLGLRGNRFGLHHRAHIPMPTLIFFGLALIGLVQSVRWSQQESSSIAAVDIQRWFLGERSELPGNSDLLSSSVRNVAETGTMEEQAQEASGTSLRSTLAISVSPEETRSTVAMLVCLATLCWVASIVFATSISQVWLFAVMAATGVLMAGIGIIQSVSYKKPALIDMDFASPFGTFVCKNSAGGYLDVCIAGGIGLMVIFLANSKRAAKVDVRYRVHDPTWLGEQIGKIQQALANLDSRQIFGLVLIAFMAAGVLISLSRGAALSMVGAMLLTLVIASRTSRSMVTWFVAAGIVLMTIGLIIVLELDTRIESRFDLLAGDAVARSQIWEVSIRAFRYYLLTGSGLGTFHFSSLPFQESLYSGWFFHAESLLLEYLVETGIVGAVLLGLGLSWILMQLRWLGRRENRRTYRPMLLAATFVMASMLIHNSIDFSLVIPAVFVPVVVILGAIAGSSQAARQHVEVEASLPAAERVTRRQRHRKPKEKEAEPTQKEAPSPIASHVLEDQPKAIQITAWFMAIAIYVCFALTVPSLWESALTENMDRSLKQVRLESRYDFEKDMKDVFTSLKWIEANPVPVRSSERLRLDALRELNQIRNTIAEVQGIDVMERWDETDPLVIQLASIRIAREHQEIRLAELLGGPQQLDRIHEVQQRFAAARTRSPLDYRTAWNALICDLRSEHLDRLASLKRMNGLIPSHPNLLFRSGLIALELGDRAFGNDNWRRSMSIDRTQVRSVATLVAQRIPDGEIDLDAFPEDMELLEQVARKHLTLTKFPKSNWEIWNRIADLAKKLPEKDYRRWIWLAKAAYYHGDWMLETECLERATRIRSSDPQVFLRLATLYANEQDFGKALDAIERGIISSVNDSALNRLREEIRKRSSEIWDNR